MDSDDDFGVSIREVCLREFALERIANGFPILFSAASTARRVVLSIGGWPARGQ